MGVKLQNLFEPIFYAILGMVMSALFVIATIQAISIQLSGRLADAFILYMAAILALLGTFIVYLRAKRIIRIITDSEYIHDLLKK